MERGSSSGATLPGVSDPAPSTDAPEGLVDGRRARLLVACHARLHELIGEGAPLGEVLNELTLGIERCEPSVMPCVVLLDRDSSTLHPGAGPSLPPEWLAAIDGVVIGPNVGSCGSAAWSGELVVSEDMASDPRWQPVRELAARCGIRHCWSMPIVGTDGAVLGTFALYGAAPRWPEPEHLELLRDGARLAGIAIERRNAMQKLIHDARHDALTGLPNRRAIFDQLEAALRRVAPGAAAAVLFVDLDGLKVLNDSLGHDRADEMIREVGDRLRASLRGRDFVGRFGGDEFVIILEDLTGRSLAEDVADRVLDTVSRPLQSIGGAGVTASVGVTLIEDEAVDVAEAIRQADCAMYAAKRAGRNDCRFYEGATPARASRRLLIGRGLHDAELRGQTTLAFQPVFELAEGTPGGAAIVGVEALVRWHHPELGDLAPAEFIPLAEETGAIVPLGAWVLRESCEEIRRLIDLTGRQLELSVNVSARQLGRPGFATSVRQTLAHARVAASSLTLEIAEDRLIDPDSVTALQLAELERAGIGLVIDDFGSGHSSLGLLGRCALRGLKLDRGFVSDISAAGASRAIVAGVVTIAEGLGGVVTAKGVETEAQLEALRELGCHRVQGFLLARPLPAAELPLLLG